MRVSGLQKIVIASGNQGKLRELQHLLQGSGIEVLAQSAFNVPEADEPYSTFIENALAKARHASQLTGLPALADDSGRTDFFCSMIALVANQVFLNRFQFNH